MLAAVVVFHEDFGAINGLGLAVLLLGVSLFNVYKYKKANATPKRPSDLSDSASTELVAVVAAAEKVQENQQSRSL